MSNLVFGVQEWKKHLKEHFNNLSNLSRPLADPQISIALNELKRVYFDGYVPYRETIYPLSLKGGPYPFSQQEFLRHGVKALLQIATFMGEIVDITKVYSENKLREKRTQILTQTSSSIGSFILIFIIILVFNYRIVEPISQVKFAILRLAKKDLDIEVPHKSVQNEIGEMARAVEIFKNMAQQLDEDFIALGNASKEREKLISELKETLNEIKILRGILPICSICKNIRNDEGYYEQIESYIHKHSGVDFSHTICHSCMKKHFPDEYSSIKNK